MVSDMTNVHMSTYGPEIVETTIKLWNKTTALKMLGAHTGAIPSSVRQLGVEDPSEFKQIESPRERIIAKIAAMAERLRIARTEVGPIIDMTPMPIDSEADQTNEAKETRETTESPE